MKDLEGIAQLEWCGNDSTLLGRLPVRISLDDNNVLTAVVRSAVDGDEAIQSLLDLGPSCMLRFADDSVAHVMVERSDSVIQLRLGAQTGCV
ncbi:hypothetical protein ACGFYY_40090 [Streptomyces sp. NPDC048331]|uniref:hypothetical protein n=1 Tax=Streptomyces sp. NPDC048331 TaxID=3365534 RepID=UPI00372064BE